MNTEIFIDAIKQVVIEDSIRGMQSNLANPPGKNPDQRIVELSRWFKSLSIEHQAIVVRIIRESVEMGVFGFLCVLDGVRAIENSENKGQLKLFYENRDKLVLLNNTESISLHELL